MTDWMTNVPCRQAPDLFFSYSVDAQQSAADICRTECEHRDECRAQAIADGDIDRNGRAVHGVIAGVIPPAVWRPPRKSQTPAACGTEQGYKRHKRHHERACDACRAANVAATTAWKKRRRAS